MWIIEELGRLDGMAAIDSGLAVRVQQLLSKHRPSLPSEDWDRLESALAYAAAGAAFDSTQPARSAPHPEDSDSGSEFDTVGEEVSDAARVVARPLSPDERMRRTLLGSAGAVYLLVATAAVVLSLTVSVARFALANAILSGILSLVGGLVGAAFGFYFKSKD